MPPQPTAAVVLGGGAPNGGLMAGALAAIYDHGKTFNEFYTSGAGSAIGLAFLAPRGNTTPGEAVRALLKVGVDDAIYRWVPFGYKTFFKRGPFTVPFKEFSKRFKLPAAVDNTGLRRLYNDWVDLVTAVVTPTDLTPRSDSLCAHYPFVEDVIDFAKLRTFNGKFFMNAYCIETGRSEQFDINQVGPEHFYAALSYPFIYAPTRIGNFHYYEGAAHDPLNLPRFHRQCCRSTVDFLVIVDLLGAFKRALIRRPTNLLDAYGISILMSVVAMAEKDVARFASFHRELQRAARRGTRTRHVYHLERLTFAIPPHDYPTMCDWSYSNMQRLWAIGYEGGTRFVQQFGNRLPNHAVDSASPV
jgi:NTE family protein